MTESLWVALFAAFFLFGFLALLFCIWMIICNEWTNREREKIIYEVFHPMEEDDFDFLRKLRAYSAISYEEHLWRRVFLKDPFELYPKELRPE